ncbi:MAG: hypothetical protein V1887_02655 [Candidatus Aenigmatarchaeota archaeon]
METKKSKKILLVILDGAGEPLGQQKTSLEAADMSLLNWMAMRGHTGLLDNQLFERADLGPDSGTSTWALLGYPKEDYPGRGWLEALGAGLQPKDGEVCMRANFATVEEVSGSDLQIVPMNPKTAPHLRLKVVDRRAGRETQGLHELAASIEKMNINGVWVRFHRSLAHRGVATISNSEISAQVSDSDPGAASNDVLEVKPLANDDRSVRTASALNKWSTDVYTVLKNNPENRHRTFPANYVLLRGASVPRTVKSFKELNGMKAACISASPVVKGIAKATEMDMVTITGITGDPRTNLRDKALQALEALKSHDIVVLHILGADVASHDRNRREKAGFLTKVDKEVFGRIREYSDFKKLVVAVTSDHCTDPSTGMHVSGSFPYMIYTEGIQSTKSTGFNERAASATGIKNDIGDLMELILQFR